jgi:hypothetical protein
MTDTMTSQNIVLSSWDTLYYYWQVSAYVLNTKFHLNRVSNDGRRTVWRDVYMIYYFVYVVQIMHQRNYDAGD